MHVYLIRHADAVPLGSEGFELDEDRPLSPEGRQQADWLATSLRRVGVPLRKVVTSPLLRARQTAEELLRSLQEPGAELLTCDALEPGGSPKKLAKFLRQLDDEHVALVGHEPDLGRYTAWLIGSKRARIEFAKAGIACVACDEPPRRGRGVLLWLLTPAWIRPT